MNTIKIVKGKPTLTPGASWINATMVAFRFGKRPIDFLRDAETGKFTRNLMDRYHCREGALIRATRGGDEAHRLTLIHPAYADLFARWLDPGLRH